MATGSLDQEFRMGPGPRQRPGHDEYIRTSFEQASMKERAERLMYEHFGTTANYKDYPQSHLFPGIAIGSEENSFIMAVSKELL